MASDGAVYRLSNSEISSFKRCRRRWMLGYYQRLQPKFQYPVGPLALGTRLHSALESYYTEGTDLLEAHAKLLDVDRQALLAEERDVTELENDGELGRIMLEGYIEWLAETGADADWEVVSAERIVAAPLFDGEVELRGKLDMRVRRIQDDAILIVDHKTTANFADLTRTAYMSEQFLTYHLLEMLSPSPDGSRCDGGVLNMLKKVKRTANARPPFYERLEVRHNKEMLRSFWARVHGEIADIMRLKAQLDSGADHRQVAYPTPTKNCTWDCEFFSVCPLMDDGSAAQQMLDELFTVGNPDARYELPQA